MPAAWFSPDFPLSPLRSNFNRAKHFHRVKDAFTVATRLSPRFGKASPEKQSECLLHLTHGADLDIESGGIQSLHVMFGDDDLLES